MLLKLLSMPIRGPFDAALWVAGKIQEHAETELHDPAAIKQALDALERALEAGHIDDETFDREEDILLARLAAAPGRREGVGP
ncbi:MAG: gas vesicle protein GvpG [Pseudomonadota bacterium]